MTMTKPTMIRMDVLDGYQQIVRSELTDDDGTLNHIQ